MKKYLLLFFVLVIYSFQAQASGTPSRYRWTGASSSNWTTAGNWIYISGPVIPGGYPGAGGPSATVPSVRHIAEFDASSSIDCNLGGSYYPSGAFYIGGIEISGYTGTITQLSGNRLFISDTYFPSGAYDDQYKAIFNFGSGGMFLGSNYSYVAASQPYQDVVSMLIAVELEIGGSGVFYAPRSLQIINHITIDPLNFDANGGVVKFYPRSGHTYLGIPVGTVANPYKMNVMGVSFYELQIYSPTWDFMGSNYTVLNDLITSGGSTTHIDDGTIHVKENVIVNCTDPFGYSYSSVGTATCGGTATIVLDGTIQQKITKTSTETAGPLPKVTINNPLGVKIEGLVGIGGLLTFQTGIVSPLTGAPSDLLVLFPSATTTGASDVSFVDGPIKKHIYCTPTTSFIFPVGKNGKYHPIIISAPTGGLAGYGSTNAANYNQFTAEYFDTPTPASANIGPGVYAVHDCQYWTLQRNNKPTSNAQVSLTWNTNTCQPTYFTTPSDLRVAQYDGSLWQNLGNSAIGTYSAGSKLTEATATPLTQYVGASPTYFTFCHATPYAPLVATISSTNVTCNGGNDGTATVTTTGEIGTLTYSWSTVPIQTTATATGLTAGTYTVTVTSSGGQVTTATVIIFEPAATTIILPFLPPVCSTSLPVLLTTNPGGVWSGGPYVIFSTGNYYFDPSISGVGSFPMTYTETSASGCVQTGSTIVDVILGPARPLGWEWAKEPDDLGESNGRDIVVDPLTGNVYTVGNFKGTIQFGSSILISAGDNDIYVVCHDNSGNIIWAKNYGGIAEDYARGLSQTGTQLTLAGYFFGTTNFNGISMTSNGDRDAFVAAIDPANGNIAWANSVGASNDDEIHAIVSDANFTYVGGYFNYGPFTTIISFGSGVTITGIVNGSFVAKYDNATGNCLWATAGVVDGQKVSIAMINTTGEIVVGGYRRSPYVFTPSYYFLESYTSSGALVNFNYIETAMTGTGSDYSGLGGIDHDASGNVFVSGVFSDPSGSGIAKFNDISMATPAYGTPSGTTLNGGTNEVFWARYDSQLNLSDATPIGANNAYFAGSSIAVDNAGNSYITGGFQGTISSLCYSIPSYGYDDVFVMKLDYNGNFIWAQKPDGGYYEAVSDIAIDPTGNVYITGFMFGSSMSFGTINLTINNSYYGSAYTAKLSPTGSSVYRESGETILAAENKTGSLNVYPNPSNGAFSIATNSTETKDVFVYDVMGKIVLTVSQTSDSNITIDITEHPAGLYIIQVVKGNSIETKRIIKQ